MLTIAYDGTDYVGWQITEGENELKKARTELGILDRKIAEDLKKTEQQEAGRQAA